MFENRRADFNKAEALFDTLSIEPRLTSIESFCESHLVIKGELPDTASDTSVKRLMFFKRSDDSAWDLKRVVSGNHAVALSTGCIVYTTSETGSSKIWASAPSVEDRLIGELQGRVAAIACGDTGSYVYCLSQEFSAEPAQFTYTPNLPGAMLFTSSKASLGRARFGAHRWILTRLDTSGRMGPEQTELDFESTGELNVMAGDHVLVGAVSEKAEQTGRFGFVRIALDGTEVSRLFDTTTAYSSVVATKTMPKIFCAGVRVAEAPGGLRQRVVVISDGDAATDLPISDELWHRPIAVSGDNRLITLAEECGKRKVFVHDLSDLQNVKTDCIETAGSVLDAQVANGRLACIESSMTQMPALLIYDLEGDAGATRVLEARPIELAGNAKQAVVRVDKYLTLASWICRPDRKVDRGIVAIFHGGPCKTWADWPWRWNPWPFVRAGFSVILPDPPMSLGYGDHAIDLGWRRWRTGIAVRAAAQVEAIRKASGMLDKPLILIGGSFGGYLALATAEQLSPDLVICHGAPADLQTVALTSDVTWQWIREYGVPSLENPDYRRESLNQFDGLRDSKVLLSHGFNDDLVPVSHAIGLHRSLQHAGVDAALAVFRDEYHGLARISNQQAWFRWVLHEIDHATSTKE